MTALPRVYLLDVEGTIAPISLVSDQLFPYARAHFAEFLEAHWNDADVLADIALLAHENRGESEVGRPQFDGAKREDALAYLLWLMDRDRKSTALKALQGRIWRSGFESGELKGTLFVDVLPALQRWSAQGRVAIYSSGSTSAQRLLIRYSVFGDLSSLIAEYFDTRTGPKTAAASYSAIVGALGVDVREICFFSDVVRELDAAREAGMLTRLVMREGNAAVAVGHGHAVVESFDGVF